MNVKDKEALKIIYDEVYLKLPNLDNTKTESFEEFVRSMNEMERSRH